MSGETMQGPVVVTGAEVLDLMRRLALADTALAALDRDPHQWSTRPCKTCQDASAALGRPWGCVRVRKERSS